MDELSNALEMVADAIDKLARSIVNLVKELVNETLRLLEFMIIYASKEYTLRIAYQSQNEKVMQCLKIYNNTKSKRIKKKQIKLMKYHILFW